MKLENGVGIVKRVMSRNEKVTGYRVIAKFHGEVQTCFESFKHSDCVRYCHDNGLVAMDEKKWETAVNASFRKVNAKVPYRAEDYRVGMVC